MTTRWHHYTTGAALLRGLGGGATLCLLTSMVWAEPPASTSASKEPTVATTQGAKPASSKELSLIDKNSLAGWKSVEYLRTGPITVENGCLILGTGDDMTGVVVTDASKLPRINYEISLEARRDEGSDFFVGLTFPVKDEYCSLILGGWGGHVCGISSINGMDASENASSVGRSFKNGQWYKVRTQVVEGKITVWLDGEHFLGADTNDVRLSTRLEVGVCEPFGLATYRSKATYRNLIVRPLDPKEIKQAKP